jgi:hypothetical protein
MPRPHALFGSNFYKVQKRLARRSCLMMSNDDGKHGQACEQIKGKISDREPTEEVFYWLRASLCFLLKSVVLPFS